VLSEEQINDAVIALEPREGEDTLRTEDILKVLDQNKDEVSTEVIVIRHHGREPGMPPILTTRLPSSGFR
jgi:hypothetical protein